MKDGTLTFYTNMPTPYQLDFFDALSDFFRLDVVYFTIKERDRQWQLASTSRKYQTKVLKDNMIARVVHKRVPSFHFSNVVFRCALKDSNDFVILNGTYWTPNIVILLLIYAIRGKAVYFYSEPLFPTKHKILSFAKKVFLSPVKWFSTGLLAVGADAIKSYRYFGYRKPIFNIPYNINIGLFQKSNLDAGKLSDLQLKYAPVGGINFLASGSLIKRKGVDVLISAFLRLRSNNCRLLILGDGPERASLEALANGHSRIHFLGFAEKTDVPYYFAISDVFVLASWYDGWALVINEAVAANLAIISSSAVGAVSDKLVHHANALICEPGNVSQFASAMESLASDRELRESLAAESSKLKDEMSSAFNAKRVYDIYSMD